MRTKRSKARPTSLITRTTCRICGSPHLAPVLSLGDHHIAGAFADPKGEAAIARRVPLELVRCDTEKDQEACGLLQTRHTVPGAILYRSYWYRSGINRTMTENLHGIAQRAEQLAELTPGDLVIDIGCNDGTLLDGYADQGPDDPRLRPLRRQPLRRREGLRRRARLLHGAGGSGSLPRAEGQGHHVDRDVLRPRGPG